MEPGRHKSFRCKPRRIWKEKKGVRTEETDSADECQQLGSGRLGRDKHGSRRKGPGDPVYRGKRNDGQGQGSPRRSKCGNQAGDQPGKDPPLSSKDLED